MVISYICGGLGNQMFQYAAARRLAVKRGAELKLDLRDYRGGTDTRTAGLEQFARPVKLYELSVTAPAATDAEIAARADRFRTSSTRDRVVRQLRKVAGERFLWPATHYRERQYRFEPAVLDLPGDAYLAGFWQSWRYFDDAADAVRADFQPKDGAIVPYAREYVDRLRSLGGPVVSLHVRRGDLAYAAETLGDVSKVHSGPLGLDYLRAAAERFPRDARLLVFSDTAKDIAWCREHLPKAGLPADRLHYADGHTDVQDLFVMAACDGHVIANSTFSWWAAWLGGPGHRVVAPSRWSPPGASRDMVTDDLIPPAWEVAKS